MDMWVGGWMGWWGHGWDRYVMLGLTRDFESGSCLHSCGSLSNKSQPPANKGSADRSWSFRRDGLVEEEWAGDLMMVAEEWAASLPWSRKCGDQRCWQKRRECEKQEMETGDCSLDVFSKKDRSEGHRVGCQDIQRAELCVNLTSGTGFVFITQIIISVTKDFSTQLLLGWPIKATGWRLTCVLQVHDSLLSQSVYSC